MSLKLEWNMLWPKVEQAVNNLQRSLAQLEGASDGQLVRQQQLQQQGTGQLRDQPQALR